MKCECPKCKRIIYNRRLKNCGYCGEIIPEELRFSAEEIEKLDQEEAEMDRARKEREMAREAEEKAKRTASGFDFNINIDIPNNGS